MFLTRVDYSLCFSGLLSGAITTSTRASSCQNGDMGVLTYDDDPVTSPLCGEPSLPLGTIVEAQEGSTGDESETETLPDPSVPPPSLSVTSYSNLKKVII